MKAHLRQVPTMIGTKAGMGFCAFTGANMRYDRRDPDPQTVKLIRAGHYLWFQLHDAKLTLTHEQQEALWAALDIIWEAKRTVKAEMAAKRRAEFAARRPFRAVAA
jgi:hypothetical protein